MQKKIILIVITVVLIFIGFWYFNISGKTPGDNSALKDTTELNKTVDSYVNEILKGSTLGSLNINFSVLDKPIFVALNYPNTPFELREPKDSGRGNPFLPIGLDDNSIISTINSSSSLKINSNIQNVTNVSTSTNNTSNNTSNNTVNNTVNSTSTVNIKTNKNTKIDF